MSADSATLVAATDTIPILGVDVAAVAYEPTIARLLDAITRRERLRVHFCTVHTVIEATRDERLRTRLNAAELVAPDGMPLVWVARLRGRRAERVCGPDVMPALLDRGRAIGARHFLYGGAPGIVRAARGPDGGEVPGRSSSSGPTARRSGR
jgi:N-acetylglucosaminyldiphosphoundecaprenol N-acetyl-beta-D-mannosaminyltransferase